MLRPALTQDLADTLLAGKHVNLISLHGLGRRQTLLDLETLLGDVSVRKIDLKREQAKWGIWFEEALSLSGQVIVIIHNIEYLKEGYKHMLKQLSLSKEISVLYVLEHKNNALNPQAKSFELTIQ